MAKSADSTPENSVKSDKKKRSILPKLFGKRDEREDYFPHRGETAHGLGLERRFTTATGCRRGHLDEPPLMRKSFSERHTSMRVERLNLSNFDGTNTSTLEVQDFRVFVGTWNVGGRSPSSNLNLEDFLQVESCSDIYVVGFQEIVPLNAGNVLVAEDNEPAAKWLILINQALNRLFDDPSASTSKSHSGPLSFQKPSLKVISKSLRVDKGLLKTCNCNSDPLSQQRRRAELISRGEFYDDDDTTSSVFDYHSHHQLSYSLIARKQMVGIFMSVWARRELIPHIGHLRISCVGTGIMGCLGNKGCISVSLSLHQTTFCFICSHLASGEKEGDEIRRNADVAEILRSTQFPKLCKHSRYKIPEKIIEHDRIIWLGDLNYRLALSYTDTKVLLEDNDWDALLERDQLIIEREAGRVFPGWHEGRIFFAPTYKYSYNSDSYAGECTKSKKKRRTPAWCDRILWYGKGIEQLSYIRGELRFSDHRPVSAIFVAQVEMGKNGDRGRRSGAVENESIPQRHSFYGF